MKYKNLHISEVAHTQLTHISKVTSIPMAKILENFIQALYGLSVEYDHATLSITDRVTEDCVYAVLHGYGKRLVVGKIPNVPTNISEQEENALIFQESKKLLEKAGKENSEVFGDA
jgi:hypothetical protein